MIKDKPLLYDYFNILSYVNVSFFITPPICNKLISPNNNIISELNYT